MREACQKSASRSVSELERVLLLELMRAELFYRCRCYPIIYISPLANGVLHVYVDDEWKIRWLSENATTIELWE